MLLVLGLIMVMCCGGVLSGSRLLFFSSMSEWWVVFRLRVWLVGVLKLWVVIFGKGCCFVGVSRFRCSCMLNSCCSVWLSLVLFSNFCCMVVMVVVGWVVLLVLKL